LFDSLIEVNRAMPRKSCARVYHFFAEWLPIHHLCIYVTYSIQKTYVIVPFGNGIALHVTMIMSLLTNLPETSGLFLMGTFLILAGLVLRRIFRMLENGDAGVSKRGPQSRQNHLKLDQEEIMSQPMSPRL